MSDSKKGGRDRASAVLVGSQTWSFHSAILSVEAMGPGLWPPGRKVAAASPGLTPAFQGRR